MLLPVGHYIFIGSSGSGKTVFACNLVNKWKVIDSSIKNLYVCNPQCLKTDVPKGFKYLDWSKLSESSAKEISNSVIVFEDLLKVEQGNKERVIKLLNYFARRSNIHMILITHSLSHTYLMGILQYVPRYLFFGAGLNVSKSFKALKDSDSLSTKIKEKGLDFLLKNDIDKGYEPIFLNIKSQSLYKVSSSGIIKDFLCGEVFPVEGVSVAGGGAASTTCLSAAAKDNLEREAKLRAFSQQFDTYFQGPSYELERKLGHFLLQNIGDMLCRHGSPLDMSLLVRTSENGNNTCRVSLLDFCAACATDSSLNKKRVTSDWKSYALFRLLSKKVEMPKFLVRNDRFRAAAAATTTNTTTTTTNVFKGQRKVPGGGSH